MAAKIANPSKVFNFSIEVNGLNAFEAQKVTLPESTIEMVAHGDTNHDIKTPGRISFTELVIEKLRPLPGADSWAWNWLMASQNPVTGGGLLPINVKQPIVIRELDNTGAATANAWLCEGCWVQKITRNDLDRMANDNVLETVTFSVDSMVKIV